MSESSDTIPQDILQTLEADSIYQWVTIAIVALLLYKYLITWDQEVEFAWRGKTRFTLPSLLLVSTRVCMVLNVILTIAQPSNPCTGVKVSYIVWQIVLSAGYIQIALFSALRVSALYNRNATLFAVIFVLGMVPVGTNIVLNIHATYTQKPGICVQDFDVSDDLIWKLLLITRIPVIVADVIVLVLTWAKTYQQMSQSDLLTCLARDGTVYILMILVINVLQIVTYRNHFGTPVDTLSTTLPPILINRFMLSLSQTGNSTQTSGTWNPNRSVVSTLGFQLSEQTFGSMGEPLDHGGSSATHEHNHEVPQEGLEASHGV